MIWASVKFHAASTSTGLHRPYAGPTKRAAGRLKPSGAGRGLAAALIAHCRALSTAGPSNGIADIHLPMRERPCSSGWRYRHWQAGRKSGIVSGGTG